MDLKSERVPPYLLGLVAAISIVITYVYYIFGGTHFLFPFFLVVLSLLIIIIYIIWNYKTAKEKGYFDILKKDTLNEAERRKSRRYKLSIIGGIIVIITIVVILLIFFNYSFKVITIEELKQNENIYLNNIFPVKVRGILTDIAPDEEGAWHMVEISSSEGTSLYVQEHGFSKGLVIGKEYIWDGFYFKHSWDEVKHLSVSNTPIPIDESENINNNIESIEITNYITATKWTTSPTSKIYSWQPGFYHDFPDGSYVSFCVNGTITNTAEYDIHTLELAAKWYDSNGKILHQNDKYVNNITKGESRDFSIELYNNPDDVEPVGDYHITISDLYFI